MPIIFVTIVNYNGDNDTLSCLKSLNEVRVEGFSLKVIVLDNASKKVFEIDRNQFDNFELSLIKSENNLGFAGGQNVAIKNALEKGAD